MSCVTTSLRWFFLCAQASLGLLFGLRRHLLICLHLSCSNLTYIQQGGVTFPSAFLSVPVVLPGPCGGGLSFNPKCSLAQGCLVAKWVRDQKQEVA